MRVEDRDDGTMPYEEDGEETPEGTVDLVSETLYLVGTLIMGGVRELLKRDHPGDDAAATRLLGICRIVAEAGLMAEEENHRNGHCIVGRGVTDWTVCRYLAHKSLRRQREEQQQTSDDTQQTNS